MRIALEVTDLRAGYGRTEVLHGIDLRVPTASVVAVLGANGAGKSTLLGAIAGQVETSSGSISLDGVPIRGLSPHRRARAGLCLIPEGRGIFRSLTVAENLGVQVGGTVQEALSALCDRFPRLGGRLSERVEQRASTLSGGEQQMLALARGLLSDASLVLADELSLGLAPIVVDAIFEALLAVKAEGRSMLLVEQYAQRALGIADYVYVLHKGRFVFVGEPAQCADGEVFERYLGAVA